VFYNAMAKAQRNSPSPMIPIQERRDAE